MCCENFWKRIIPFVLSIGLSSLVVNILQKENLVENKQEKSNVKFIHPQRIHSETGISDGAYRGSLGESDKKLLSFNARKSSDSFNLKKKELKIISKPRPIYTDAARQNQIQGIARLRVNFLATGQVGNVSPITELPDGLTEQAIAAAKQIRFEPATRENIPSSTIKIIEYRFTIY